MGNTYSWLTLQNSNLFFVFITFKFKFKSWLNFPPIFYLNKLSIALPMLNQGFVTHKRIHENIIGVLLLEKKKKIAWEKLDVIDMYNLFSQYAKYSRKKYNSNEMV